MEPNFKKLVPLLPVKISYTKFNDNFKKILADKTR